MRFEMKMPDLATTESEIRIVRWLIEPGEKIERGQPLVEVETDKATMEVESIVSGVLSDVRCQVDEAVSVGQVIAVLEVEGATPQAVFRGSVDEPKTDAIAAAVSAAGRPRGGWPGRHVRTQSGRGRSPGDRPRGADGRHSAHRCPTRRGQAVAGEQTDYPALFLQTSVKATAMAARRKAAEPVKLAWDAFFVLAVARAMTRFDRFRCRFDGACLTPIEADAIGVAVDQENELFVVPIASPAAKTVEQISDEIRQGVERLRGGDSEARRIRPALMTVTNLGVCNIECFVPIINPPESAILGIGRVRPTPVVQDDGRIGVEPRCTLTLSVDHRIASGKYAGGFLGAIVKELESF